MSPVLQKTEFKFKLSAPDYPRASQAYLFCLTDAWIVIQSSHVRGATNSIEIGLETSCHRLCMGLFCNNIT